MPPARSVRHTREGDMTISEDLEEQAAEAGQWLRELETTDLSIEEGIATETVDVAVGTSDPDLYVCWPQGITVKGKMLQTVKDCIKVGAQSGVFFTKTGVVIRESKAWGRHVLFLRRKAVKCYEQVRASELATKLNNEQLQALHDTLKRVTRRRKPSDATDA